MKDDYERAIIKLYENRFFVNHGPLAQKFELTLCHHFSAQHAVTVGNSTLALLIAAQGFLTGKVGVSPSCNPIVVDALRMAALEWVVGFDDVESAVVDDMDTPLPRLTKVVTYSTCLPKAGVHVPRDGVVSVFSLGSESNVSTLQGGVIVTNDGELADVFRNIRSSYGMRAKKTVKATCNGRFSEFQAGIGLIRLNKMAR